MDWIQWYCEPPLTCPTPHPQPRREALAPPDLDVELIDLVYLTIANEQEYTECGLRLGRGLHVRNTPPD